MSSREFASARFEPIVARHVPPVRAARARSVPAQPLLQLQRYHGNRYVQDVVGRARAKAHGAGRPLDQRAAAEMEAVFGADFRRVRVHADEQADQLSRSLGAAAFTIGEDIFFRARQYNPGSSEGTRLLAHELAHVIQQGAGTRGAPLSAADDPAERAADRVADDVVRGGRAEPAAVVAPVPLIQRRAFIGANPLIAPRARFGLPSIKKKQTAEDAAIIPDGRDDHGTSEHSVHAIVQDARSRYFHDRDELYDYAAMETEDIGYVDREKTWVRLPDRFLVLGERHNGTTLPDLVKATGTKRYIYEAGARPSSYLRPGVEVPEDRTLHVLEEILPKLVVGLIGVQETLQHELADLWRLPGWKSRIRAKRRKADRADPEKDQRQYEEKLADWSSGWEARNERPDERGWRKAAGHAYVGARARPGEQSSNVLMDEAPDAPYSRPATEVALALMALEELRDAARAHHDPITRFYAKYQKVIDKTITQLKLGLPVQFTRMFLEMADRNFDLEGLINILTTAAESEFTASGQADISAHYGYQRNYETETAGHRMEELRDTYMVQNILKAKEHGCRLAGVGDNHRQNLQGVFEMMDPEILVMKWTEFYADQYQRHPDRD